MLIKIMYDIETEDKETSRYGDSMYDGVSERHVTRTFTPDGRAVVDLTFKDMHGDSHSFYVTGTAYVMSDSGKTVDTIAGGVLPDGVYYGEEGILCKKDGTPEPSAADMI
jgi:hypothetical protein